MRRHWEDIFLLSLALATLLLASGCAVRQNLETSIAEVKASAAVSTPGSTPSTADPVEVLRQFTINDLSDAKADADSHADKIASMCYAELIVTVRSLPNPTPQKIMGAFSAFQAGRDVVNGVKSLQSGLPQALNIACAPLVLDAQNTVLMLARKVGIVAGVPGLGLIP